jgi:D-glycero-alpha-D-manno-heptose-7-phosphate kinase
VASSAEDVAVPGSVVRAAAPTRICDLGGWTDTWFAGHGMVCNIAVSPGVEVHVAVHEARGVPDRITFDLRSYGDSYSFAPGHGPGRHPLLEAVVEEVGLPDDLSIVVRVDSEMPPGSSTGTSAATAVALLGALDALTPGRLTPGQVADLAHRVEADRLGLQSGVQDQICAAFGGVTYMEIDPYPQVSPSPIALSAPVWRALEQRLLLVYLGRAHTSSDLHDKLIARLARDGHDAPVLQHLRRCANGAKEALCEGDLGRLGRIMTENTDAQSTLHEDLVSAEARSVMQMAEARGAIGWKVNGAGGEGGSVTILCGEDDHCDGHRRRGLADALVAAAPRWRVIPIRLSRRGLRVAVV